MIKQLTAIIILTMLPTLALATDKTIHCKTQDDKKHDLYVQFNWEHMIASARYEDLTEAKADLVFKNGTNKAYQTYKEATAPYSQQALLHGTYFRKAETLTGSLTITDIANDGTITEAYAIRINRKSGEAVIDTGELNNTGGYVIPFNVETKLLCTPYQETLF